MSNTIGTPFKEGARRVLLCGSGELGKEVVIELQRYGVEVIAMDAYTNAPAMQVADRAHVISMLDGDALRGVIEKEQPDLVVPEVEAIATDVLAEIEAEGKVEIIPTARATQLTMNREGIRRLAAEELGLRTSPYEFAASKEEYLAAVEKIGMPCVIKPIMSSSGKGQSTVKTEADIDTSWQYAQEGGRAGAGKVIVEGFVDFDYEITLLTVRHVEGRQPRRIILDSGARTPISSHILNGEAPTTVCVTDAAPQDRIKSLLDAGAEMLVLPTGSDNHIDLNALKRELGAQQILTLMIEGGSQITTAFLKSRAVDQITCFIAPLIMGAGLEVVGNLDTTDVSQAIRLHKTKIEQLGNDFLLTGQPIYAPPITTSPHHHITTY